MVDLRGRERKRGLSPSRAAGSERIDGSSRIQVVAAGLAGVLLLTCGAALAQGAPPLRRIAPDLVPDYRDTTVATPDPAITMPDRARSFGSCERGMQRVVWLRCLKATADLTDQKVNDTAGLVQQKLDAKAGASGRKRFWARALTQSQDLWRELRNHECQQLATAEADLATDVYEARLLCLLRADTQRIGELKARYQIDG